MGLILIMGLRWASSGSGGRVVVEEIEVEDVDIELEVELVEIVVAD